MPLYEAVVFPNKEKRNKLTNKTKATEKLLMSGIISHRFILYRQGRESCDV
jgi:hypothetical protein